MLWFRAVTRTCPDTEMQSQVLRTVPTYKTRGEIVSWRKKDEDCNSENG